MRCNAMHPTLKPDLAMRIMLATSFLPTTTQRRSRPFVASKNSFNQEGRAISEMCGKYAAQARGALAWKMMGVSLSSSFFINSRSSSSLSHFHTASPLLPLVFFTITG